jgi:hypothetical protein
MSSTHIWNKLNLHRAKIVFALLFLCFSSASIDLLAQKKKGGVDFNLPNYDDRWIHYGFAIGGHSARYRIRYADQFSSQRFDSLHSITTENTPGFSLGFIVNFRLLQFLDFRVLPKVAFYEHIVRYNLTDGRSNLQLVENVNVELPLFLKYKSERRGNFRVYTVGGLNPTLEASGRRSDDNAIERLVVRNFNVNFEYGFGIDIYYPLFKFSPELRFSHGLRNVLGEKINRYSEPLQGLTTHSVGLYILFE